MNIEPFELEREQCRYENTVRYNLAESGVHPLAVAELIDPAEIAGLRLGYSQANGTPELRGLIAAQYPGSGIENILVTHGACEANFLSIWNLVDPGDEVVVMLPNYLQIWGIARGFGAIVKPFHLRAECAWEPDFDELRRSVSPRTKLICVCNPNNPTGAILSSSSMQTIVRIAEECGAWLLADEVYRGAERSGVTTASFWGMYPRTLITSGLSKAYGAPGLRIGWIAGPADTVDRLWGYHDYTAITVSTLSDRLARAVLEKRDSILARTRRILNENLPILEQWIAGLPGVFTLPPTHAGAIGYPSYDLPIGSAELATRLRTERSVLVIPGSHFGMEHYLRLNYGVSPSHLREGLAQLSELVGEIRNTSYA